MLEAVEEAIALDKTPLTRQERAQVTREIADDILGYGPLEPFLADDPSPRSWSTAPTRSASSAAASSSAPTSRFVDDQHLRRVIDKIVGRIGRRIDEASPMVDARLPDGSRVNAIIPPLAVDGPVAHHPEVLDGPVARWRTCIRFGTLTPQMRPRSLEACVRGKLNILVSGGTGSGKTTMLNVLSGVHSGGRAHRHHRGRGRAPAAARST